MPADSKRIVVSIPVMDVSKKSEGSFWTDASFVGRRQYVGDRQLGRTVVFITGDVVPGPETPMSIPGAYRFGSHVSLCLVRTVTRTLIPHP